MTLRNTFLGAVDAYSGESQFLMFGADHIRYERTTEMVRSSMAESIWNQDFNTGRKLTLDEARDLVLEDDTH